MLHLQEDVPNHVATIVRVLPDIAEHLLSDTHKEYERLYLILASLLQKQNEGITSTLIFNKAIFSAGCSPTMTGLLPAESGMDHSDDLKLDLSISHHFTDIILHLLEILLSNEESWIRVKDGMQRLHTVLNLHLLFQFSQLKILYGERKARFVMDHILHLESPQYPVYPNDAFPTTQDSGVDPYMVAEERQEALYQSLIQRFLRLTMGISHSVEDESDEAFDMQRRPQPNADVTPISGHSHDLTENRFRGLFRYYCSGIRPVRSPQFNRCCDVIISEGRSSMPARFLSLLSEVVHDLAIQAPLHDYIKPGLDRLFRHFLQHDLDPTPYECDPVFSSPSNRPKQIRGHRAAPVGPRGVNDTEPEVKQTIETEDSRTSTLTALVHMVARELDTPESDSQSSWTELLVSWLKLVQQKHLLSTRQRATPNVHSSKFWTAPSPGFGEVFDVIRGMIKQHSSDVAQKLPALIDEHEHEASPETLPLPNGLPAPMSHGLAKLRFEWRTLSSESLSSDSALLPAIES